MKDTSTALETTQAKLEATKTDLDQSTATNEKKRLKSNLYQERYAAGRRRLQASRKEELTRPTTVDAQRLDAQTAKRP
ncbi:hypothetical protein CPI31_08865 [Moraxella catarrhalis]|uniref:hypothetical protein n=1 Tax=Moraxella catarrhalis TaxID=480 RepID=UPI00128C9DFC|nr:hypothetical protein [Moraxella catarrhalis]MPX19651.1 hypothetical protein [Moraxella catarrhalis]